MVGLWISLAYAEPHVAYSLRYEGASEIEVKMSVSGLDAGAPVTLALPWQPGSPEKYVTDVTAVAGSIRVVEGGYELTPADAVPVQVHYRLHAQAAPSDLLDGMICAPDYCLAFADHVLLQVGDDEPRRTLSLAVPEGWTASTGWGPPGSGDISLDRIHGQNGVLAFYKAARTAERTVNGVDIHLLQLGGDRDFSGPVADIVAHLYGDYLAQAGFSPRRAKASGGRSPKR